ncbi:MAG TPA: MarR family transcriptional regulator [Chromatiales bacterium]|nr:MarR family transcriptional regulator [Chromatiales bacterium]
MSEPASTVQRELAELLMQLGRTAYAGAGGRGLTAAQWAALRYFSRANRFSRTVSGFAEFHATTRGTASQTVRSLTRRGFLSRRRSERDGRSVLFELTGSARQMLASDPLNDLVAAAAWLDDQRCAGLIRDLVQISDRLVQECAGTRPGVCARCGHLVGSGGTYRCGLMQEPLDDEELTELCQRFSPQAATS